MRKIVLSTLVTLLALSVRTSAASAATTHVWSVKFLCGVVPEFPLSVWFSDVNIHNPHKGPVTFNFKVTTEGGILNSGAVTLPGNGVLDSGCGDIVGPTPWGVKGFVELESSKKLQVIGILKNYAFSETKREKGFVIDPRQVGERQWVYSTEYLCGDIERRMPSSLADIVGIFTDEDILKAWRPGLEGSDFFVHNTGPTTATYNLKIIDTNQAVLLDRGRQTLPPDGVLKVDCDSFDLPGPRSEGFFVVQSDSAWLNAMLDIWKYETQFSVAMDMNEYRPVITRTSK